jgi:hypothetical protein
MPITPFLTNQAFDPEAVKAMSDVLERVCAEIGVTLGDTRKNPSAEIIAAKIIALHAIRLWKPLFVVSTSAAALPYDPHTSVAVTEERLIRRCAFSILRRIALGSRIQAFPPQMWFALMNI